MNQIKDPPLEYDFGLDFNYAVWTPGTIITMCNVPWNNDYRDIVKFISRNALNLYIDGLSAASINLTGMSYVKQGQPIRINVPFNRAYKYNYLRAKNPIQPVPGSDEAKDYYYFITDVRYLAPNTTEIVVQLDVWQTFGFDVTFGNCYVERGHIGIANENQFVNYGRDYLTVPEGLDIGSDHQIVSQYTQPIMDPTSMNVAVCSTVDLTADPGTVDNPKLVSAKGGTFAGVVSGASFYLFQSAYSFSTWLTSMQTKPWVTQGIITAYIIPSDYFTGFVTWPADGTPTAMPSAYPIATQHDMVSNWRNLFVDNLPDRYEHLQKFKVSPYAMVELTAFTGNPIIIKPELWYDNIGRVQEIPALIPPGIKVVFYPVKYNAKSVTAQGEDLDHATVIGALPEIPVVNNGAMQYLAANKNSIMFQRESADWTQQRALGSNQAQYDVQTNAIETSRGLNAIGQIANSGQTGIANQLASTQAMTGMVGSPFAGIAGGAAFGPHAAIAGGLGGGANGIIQGIQSGSQVAANDQSTALRNSTMAAQNAIETRQTGFARDTNKNLADWAARGDYANSIAGINAKVRDAQMIQPSVSGQFGGETLNYTTGNFKVALRFKMIDQAAIRTVGEYWLRYGYMVHKFLQPPASLMAMTKFTYWKMSESYITAAPIPETYKQTIRGIFEKGVTVWATPADIGVIDIADNDVIPGISY